ncbi:MAG: hypothetical protein RIF33_17680 [Cyclobacteriaceae bacterium]
MTALANPYLQFKDKAQACEAEIKVLKNRLNSLTISRLVVFLLSAALSIYFLSEKEGLSLAISLTVVAPLFIWLVFSYQKKKTRLQITEHLKDINQEELQRLDGNLKGLDDGMSHLDKDHPFALDLDIFGSPSLYQLVNRTTTKKGNEKLIEALLSHLDNDKIGARQQAVQELGKELEFRQQLEAAGRYYKGKDEKARIESSDSALINWIADNEHLGNKVLLKVFNVFSPFTLFIMIAVYPSYAIHLVLGFIFFHYVVMVGFVSKVNKMSREVTRSLNLIRTYKEIILKLERQSFEGAELVGLQARLGRDGKSANKILKQLENILQNFDNRANMIYGIINGVLLLDLYWYLKALEWKDEYGELMLDWIEVAAELEMMSSLSAFAYAHPQFVFPELKKGQEYHIQTVDLGHPLIPQDKRITNDFEVKGEGTVGLVTGSNMSGKSTFLRTVGLNIVLAQMGLPVCASKFTWAPIKVFSGMRTQDDLGESVSSFYAELKRIRELLDLTTETPALYLLDEILKGTNSDDRHKGGIALIAQLSERSAVGLISTHDLALGKLEDTNKKLINYSFNSRLDDGELIFDYRISDGICRSFNASVLMQKMGIIPTSSAS